MNRLKALYPSWAIPCVWTQVYAPRYRSEWLSKITATGVSRRAELYYQQLDALRFLHQQARKELLAKCRKYSASKLLGQLPGIGTLRAAQLVALMQTPHRFRTKRQLWTYSRLGLETHDSDRRDCNHFREDFSFASPSRACANFGLSLSAFS